jgi:hypothetical protein
MRYDVLYASLMNQRMIHNFSMHLNTKHNKFALQKFRIVFLHTLDETLENGNNSHPLTNDSRIKSYNRNINIFSTKVK